MTSEKDLMIMHDHVVIQEDHMIVEDIIVFQEDLMTMRSGASDLNC